MYLSLPLNQTIIDGVPNLHRFPKKHPKDSQVQVLDQPPDKKTASLIEKETMNNRISNDERRVTN
jgi:hypothetical protein